MGVDYNVSQQKPFGVQDSKLVFKLKVIRPLLIWRRSSPDNVYRLCDDPYRRRVTRRYIPLAGEAAKWKCRKP